MWQTWILQWLPALILYVCRRWLEKANPLPGEYSRFGVFDMMAENNRTRLKELITGLASDPKSKQKGTIAQR